MMSDIVMTFEEKPYKSVTFFMRANDDINKPSNEFERTISHATLTFPDYQD